MFKEEEAEFGLEALESYLSESIISAERRKDKTAGMKPLAL